VPIIVGDSAKALNIAKKLKESKFLISAIRPPTVETGTARLRITFLQAQKKSDIKKLANLIHQFF
jgi:8-amino-7-oxononanoate synthase